MPAPVISPQLEDRLSTVYEPHELVPISVFVAGWPPHKRRITRAAQILAINQLERYATFRGYFWVRHLPDGLTSSEPGWPSLSMSLTPDEVRSFAGVVGDNGSPLIAAIHENMVFAKKAPEIPHYDG